MVCEGRILVWCAGADGVPCRRPWVVGRLCVATSSRALGTRELRALFYPPFLLSTSSPPFAPAVGRHSPSPPLRYLLGGDVCRGG